MPDKQVYEKYTIILHNFYNNLKTKDKYLAKLEKLKRKL